MKDVLTRAGYRDIEMESVSELMYFGPDADNAAQFIGGQFADFLVDLEPQTRGRAVADLRRDMACHESEGGVYYSSAAWLIRAKWIGKASGGRTG